MEVLRRLKRRPTLDLDDIQATVLRARPEPYFGTHAIIEITDQAAGKALLGRLAPRVTSAAHWDEPAPSWLALAISYRGLVALGVPQESLDSFPANFRAGMAARAERLRDTGPNAPEHWEAPFGSPEVHLAVTVFAASEADWRAEVTGYEQELRRLTGVNLLSYQNFGANGFNVFGYRDGFSQPLVEGSGAEPLPGDGRAIRAGEFVLGYPSETGQPLAMPAPDVLGRNGTFVVFRKYHSHVAAFNRWLRDNGRTEQERELLAAKLVGRWRSGAPLALSPTSDDPALGENPRRINDFDYADDPRGLKTPLGSHIRRMNPRNTKLEVLSDVNIRRIIRRSTSFGESTLALTDDHQDRGLVGGHAHDRGRPGAELLDVGPRLLHEFPELVLRQEDPTAVALQDSVEALGGDVQQPVPFDLGRERGRGRCLRSNVIVSRWSGIGIRSSGCWPSAE